MKEKEINILHLYSHDMNVYGDLGNVLCLKQRLKWYGYKVTVVEYNPGDELPDCVDILVGGGGQDSGQSKIQEDLLSIGIRIKTLADRNVPMLVICGMYQLFGKFFKTSDGKTIDGIGIFDIKTFGKSERLIGNIVTYSEQFGEIIGYENHSGQTFLGQNVSPFGRVRIGAGNNTVDISEGARYKNIIGTYLHGSLLPKNPRVADFIIEQAVINKYGKFEPKAEIDDKIADLAREVAIKRPR
ncbi:MAG: glutamine amidotransferase [Candidatus Saccharimonadaceae bacterium]|nr:glutamine amidotransferase [Candidatus Saccharimonadaceae bacterium]